MTQDHGTPGGPTSSAGGSVLKDLVAECLARIEREGDLAIEAVCREHPAHAAALRRRLSLLRGAGVLEAPPPATPEFPERLGEFRILERIGSGGMGVVFLAEQESLKRRLALKVIRPEHLFFAGSRERFRREVETVARLQHPGIVPVYTVGEEGGVPYFTMEWIAGASVAEVLRALRGIAPRRLSGKHLRRVLAEAPGATRAAAASEFEGSWVDVCLRIVVKAAMALDHAHQNGVLHRDVKPSNLMLTGAGRVVLLDFGLATAEGATKLTRTGSDLGSVPYMAPEQLRGDWASVDERTDVYALGVTLYEMLTLREAFLGETSDVTRARVLTGEVAPIRTLNPAVPWDAETVCMKAMDPDPARRYASAAELARDLRNVLELHPITAERPGPVLRTRLWVRRHPARSLAILLGFILVVVAPTTFGLQRWAAAEEIGAALAHAQAEQRQKERVFSTSVEAVDRFLTRVTEETLVRQPHDDALRRRLLEDAAGFYEELLRQEGAGTLLSHDGAKMAMRRGNLLARLEATESAEASLRKALESYARLAQEDPADARARRGHACAKANLAILLERTSRSATGEALFREVLADLTTELTLAPDDRECLRLEAAVSTCLGVNLMRSERLAEAEAVFAPLVARLDSPAPHAGSTDPEVRGYIARATCALGEVKMATQRPDEAEPLYEKSLALHRAVLAEKGAKEDAEPAVARTLQRLADLRWRQHRYAEAESGGRAALELIERQLAQSPLRGDLLQDLAAGRRLLGQGLLSISRNDDAEAELRAAEAAWRQLAERTPSGQSYLSNLAGTQVSLAWALSARGEMAAAIALCRGAAERLQKLLETTPDSSVLRLERARAFHFLGQFLEQTGDPVAASAAYEQAVAEQLLRLVKEPRAKRLFPALATYVEAHVTLELERGDAASLAESAERLAALDSAGPEGPRLAVTMLARCARAASQAGNRGGDAGGAADQAKSYADRAMAHLAEAVRRGFKDREDLEADASLRGLRRRADFASVVSGGPPQSR